jgi:hypothetical protein
MNSRGERWVGHAELNGDKSNTYKTHLGGLDRDGKLVSKKHHVTTAD